MLVKKSRYPFSNRQAIVSFISMLLGGFILVELLASVSELLLLLFAETVGILLSGGVVFYLIEEQHLSKVKSSLEEHTHQVPLGRVSSQSFRRGIIRNLFLLVGAVAIPIALSYFIPPVLWLALVASFFLSIILGRLAFFLRVRFWEAQNNLTLSVYHQQTKNPDGTSTLEHGIIAEASRSLAN